MPSSLHTKYRPTTLTEVFGHKATIRSLKDVIKKRSNHAFLFTGPSGVGKTTLARIVAAAFNCTPENIIEVDAATYTGIDAMRDVQDRIRHVPLGDGSKRGIIIDEAHALTRQAVSSLLKAIEEPPSFVYWFICTTEAGKIPPTIKTRVAHYPLKELSTNELSELLDYVLDSEKIDIDDGVRSLIIKEASGSPRQLIVNLGVCAAAKNRQEAAQLLQSVLDSDATIELCRFMLSGGSWTKAMSIVARIDGNYESARIVTSNYIGKVLANAKGEREAVRLLNILDAFAEPYNASENVAPLLRSIGRVLFSGGE